MSKAIELISDCHSELVTLHTLISHPNEKAEVWARHRKVCKMMREALALLAKPEPCKTCGGLKVVCKDDIGLAFGGVAATCPRCKGTGREPEPEPSEFIKGFRELIKLSEEHSSSSKTGRMQKKGKEACDLLASQQAEIGRHRWIPASERLPEKGKYILVFCPKTQMVGEVFASDGIDFANTYTHWQPIILPDQALSEDK